MDMNGAKISGIFFEESKMTLGTGHTQKTQIIKNYCRAEQLDAETVKVMYLGTDGNPTGIEIQVPCQDFLKKYTFDPNFKVKTKEEKQLDKHIALAEKHRSRREFNSAEWEYTSALKIDQENIKANFGIGTLYMEMGEVDKAKDVFKKLTQIEAIFEDENKHIFNEFGIELRKTQMFDEALGNYMKALEISPQDENLYFNVARLHFDLKDFAKALEWIDRAIEVNPDFRDAKRFKAVIVDRLDGRDIDMDPGISELPAKGAGETCGD